jgi:ribosomal protein S18 acetylase RimI-like enzyme
MAASMKASTAETAGMRSVSIRQVTNTDIPQVIALDERVTGLTKSPYWHDVFERFGQRGLRERFFLVAEDGQVESDPPMLGFIVGEVRAWEFGSEPCGWVLALSVEPRARLRGIGEALFDAISIEFKRAGVGTMRTMVARDNRLHLLFFRSEGMIAGPYIQLEKEID